jgi:hypothetical protein
MYFVTIFSVRLANMILFIHRDVGRLIRLTHGILTDPLIPLRLSANGYLQRSIPADRPRLYLDQPNDTELANVADGGNRKPSSWRAAAAALVLVTSSPCD